jgi:hypothetical protein
MKRIILLMVFMAIITALAVSMAAADVREINLHACDPGQAENSEIIYLTVHHPDHCVLTTPNEM